MSPSRHHYPSPHNTDPNRHHHESPLRRTGGEDGHSRSRSPRPRYHHGDSHSHQSFRDSRDGDRYYRDRHRQSSNVNRSRSPEPGFRRPRTPILTAQHYQPHRDDRTLPARDRRPLTPPSHRRGERSPPHRNERHHISGREDREEIKRPLTSILVSALTPNVTTPHLQEIFSFYGSIASISVPINSQSGLTRGIAYINYSAEQDAINAVNHMDKGQIDGNVVRVEQRAGMPQRSIPSR